MRRRFTCRLFLLLLPALLSGCCTYLTIDGATHDFLHDSVWRIGKAGISSHDKLVMLVEGTRAESLRTRRFTITVSLPANEDGIYVPKDAMTEGWDLKLLDRPHMLPVTVAPPVELPAYYSARGNQDRFPKIPGAERTLYLVRHPRPDKWQTPMFYVEEAPRHRKIDIYPDGRDVKTPQRYPLLVFVPVTIAIDAATFPIQLIFLGNLGDKPSRPPLLDAPTQ